MQNNLIRVVLLLITSITGAPAEADPWKDLFDGVSLNGWKQQNDEDADDRHHYQEFDQGESCR